MKTQKILQNLSVNEKALYLNLLIREKYPATQLASCDLSKILEGYGKETNMVIDSYMWNLYGLHYKDYLDTILAGCGICTYDVFKLEQAIDNKILYHLGEN